MTDRIVILGGYGAFGARISRALAREAHAQLFIAGRRIERAGRLAGRLRAEHPGARIDAVELDAADPTFVRRLGAIAPIVVVHAAGPFQDQDYAVAEACLAVRSHYVDLADARRFVADFARLDRDAKRRRLLLVSGASTLPGVSSAVVDALAAGMTSIRAIETSIAPAGRSRRGPATVAAVLSYCGKPFRTLEGGAWIERVGWHDTRSIRYPVFERRVAACDVPDLELFPARYPGLETVTFHAGAESAWQHAALGLMARLTRAGLVRDWSRHARLFASAARWSERGTDVGAMRVVVHGVDAERGALRRTWDLVARQNHGPFVPCVPALVIAKRLLAGALVERGAKPCLGFIDLGDFNREVAGLDIDCHVTEQDCRC